jgi:hypothetical protein
MLNVRALKQGAAGLSTKSTRTAFVTGGLLKKLAPLLLFTLVLLPACSSKPVLVPNEKYSAAGKEGSGRDVDQCTEAANTRLRKTKRTAKAKEQARFLLVTYCLRQKGYEVAGWN